MLITEDFLLKVVIGVFRDGGPRNAVVTVDEKCTMTTTASFGSNANDAKLQIQTIDGELRFSAFNGMIGKPVFGPKGFNGIVWKSRRRGDIFWRKV